MDEPRHDMDTERTSWTCEWCGHVWGNRFSASRCCDEAMMSMDEQPRITRAYD